MKKHLITLLAACCLLAALSVSANALEYTFDSAGAGSVSGGYTEVTKDSYYKGGHLGTLEIPAIDLTVNIYQGTDSATLKKGAGHFEETSIWNGNVGLAAVRPDRA